MDNDTEEEYCDHLSFFLKIKAKCKTLGMNLLITSVAIWQTNTKTKTSVDTAVRTLTAM